jgi:uncharacterized protein (DUF927 family)
MSDKSKAVRLAVLETADPLAGPVPAVPIMPPGYRWEMNSPEAGLWHDPPANDDGKGRAMRLAGPFTIAAETHDADNMAWGLLLKWCDPAGRPHDWAMPRSLLAGRKAAVWETLMDGGLFVAASEAARNRLADFLNSFRPSVRAIAVERTGWHDGLFVMPGRAYGPDRDRLAVYQGAALPKGFMASRGSLDSWRREVATKAEGNSRLAVCLSAAFVGPVMDLIGAEGGGLHLRGDTSGGKTTCLRAAASVYGDPGVWMQSWRMTANGLESIATQHSETLLCLDELRELAPREAVPVAYMLAHGRAKARQRAEGGLRRQPHWRVFFLSTGELSLSDLAAQAGDKAAGGTDVRLLDIPADAGAGHGVWEALHGNATPRGLADDLNDAVRHHYGTAGPAFLERLASNREGALLAIRAAMEQWLAQHVPRDASGMVQRGAKRFALVAAAGELARSFGVLPWPAGWAEHAADQLFRAWLEARGGGGAPEDERAMAALRAFIATHGSARFERAPTDPDTVADRAVINRAGWWRFIGPDGATRRQWLITPAAWQEVAQHAGLPGERVAKAAVAAGWLQIGSDGKSSRPISLPGLNKQRLYVIQPADDG